jgi:hypothetical protein
VGSALLVSPFSRCPFLCPSLARSPFRRSSTLSSPWNTRPSLWCLLCLITSGYISRAKAEVGEVTETCFATFTLPRILLLFSPLIQSSLLAFDEKHSPRDNRRPRRFVGTQHRGFLFPSEESIAEKDSDRVIRRQRVRSPCVCSR